MYKIKNCHALEILSLLINNSKFLYPNKNISFSQVIEVLDVKTHEYFGYNTNRNNDIAILVLKVRVGIVSRQYIKFLLRTC